MYPIAIEEVVRVTFSEYMLGTFFPTTWERIVQVSTAPVKYPDMVWILTPMIITLLLMTFYFGRYKKEELGWNTAFGNALVLLFVSIDLFKTIYPHANPFQAILVFFRELFALLSSGTFLVALGEFLPGLVAGGILLYATILLTADFYHWLPKKFAFFISSGLPINTLAYFGIIFVYTRTAGDASIPLDWYLFVALLLLFIVLLAVLTLLKGIEPSRDTEALAKEAPKPKRRRYVPRPAEPASPAKSESFESGLPEEMGPVPEPDAPSVEGPLADDLEGGSPFEDRNL